MKRNDLVKRELSNTLKALIREKPLESVTVSEISTACGVSRGTFYNHFLDIYDLINWTFETDVITPLAGLHHEPHAHLVWHHLRVPSEDVC